MKQAWNRISRPVRILILLAITALLTGIVYILLGAPALTAEMAFRRQERAHMVGPSTIIAQYTDSPGSYSHLVIAETEDIYALFGANPDRGYAGQFYWYPKTGQPTFLSAPGSNPVYRDEFHSTNWPLELFLLGADPRAVRAEFEVTVSFGRTEEGVSTDHTVTVTAEAQREHGNVFRFILYADAVDSITDPEVMATALSVISLRCQSFLPKQPPVTLRLYDAQGALLSTQTLPFGPVA